MDIKIQIHFQIINMMIATEGMEFIKFKNNKIILIQLNYFAILISNSYKSVDNHF